MGSLVELGGIEPPSDKCFWTDVCKLSLAWIILCVWSETKHTQDYRSQFWRARDRTPMHASSINIAPAFPYWASGRRMGFTQLSENRSECRNTESVLDHRHDVFCIWRLCDGFM